jgi:hypothetical protein
MACEEDLKSVNISSIIINEIEPEDCGAKVRRCREKRPAENEKAREAAGAVFRSMQEAARHLAFFRGPLAAEKIVEEKVGCGSRIRTYDLRVMSLTISRAGYRCGAGFFASYSRTQTARRRQLG